MRGLLTTCLVTALLASACGQDDLASIAVKIEMATAATGGLRGFTPENPPEWVYAAVIRSSDLAEEGGDFKAVVEIDQAWDEMETDPLTGRRLMLLSVKPNAGKDDPYLLQVESQVTDPLGRRLVDACGVVGGIQTEKGEKKAVELVAHADACGLVCADDVRCVGPRWCLDFECQAEASCSADDDCPEGAWCDEGYCSGRCGAGLPECRNDGDLEQSYACCEGTCALSCAD